VTMLQGKVFDISQKCESGEISTDVAGEINAPTTGAEAFRIPSEREACKVFGEEVAKFLVGKEKTE